MSQNLMNKTIELLKTRPRQLTYADVAKGASVTESWLKWFISDKCEAPDVNKVERVYNYLNGTPLNV